MQNRYRERLSEGWSALEKRMMPGYVWASDPLTLWRERILFLICFIAAVFGPGALVPSLVLAYREGLWNVIVIDTAAYLAAVGILAARNTAFTLRALAFCLVLYSLGVCLIFILGPFGAGYIWLFGASVLISAFIGTAAAVWTLVLNATALLAVGIFVVHGHPGWAVQMENALEKWVVLSANFLLLNGFVTLTTAFMLNGLKAALHTEQTISGAYKRAEAERAKLQSQVIQAQKMEAVGRLAGGVAHDFNNMLGVILGHAELAMEQMDPGRPWFEDLQEIHKAAKRSANLTRQLLAFARQQTIVPEVLDLNATVEEMLKMLRRLIGEDIDLVWRPATGLWPVKMDPSQIDQILANLCVNARDAIDGTGKVTIETGNSVLDAAYCGGHPGFVAGDFVLLAVSDNGRGMDAETLANIFEPFFTTKGIGQGTGLGLATVYGIAKQNNGFINVYSEPGHGTTFKIYLPRHGRQALQGQKETSLPLARGQETILLVEDEPTILNMTQTMLKRLGYTVLAAGSPGQAIGLAQAHPSRIDLLITDVIMPEMNGRETAKTLTARFADLKCLFMSGYTASAIAHHGVLEPGIDFIQKPFSRQDLAAKVRAVLDRHG